MNRVCLTCKNIRQDSGASVEECVTARVLDEASTRLYMHRQADGVTRRMRHENVVLPNERENCVQNDLNAETCLKFKVLSTLYIKEYSLQSKEG